MADLALAGRPFDFFVARKLISTTWYIEGRVVLDKASQIK